jgi:hypothetical protein
MSSGFFSAPRGKVLKFPTVGTRHVLYISQEVELEQQTTMEGEPLWRDPERTKPLEQAVVSGYVTDGLTGADDGFRSLYVRAGVQRAIRVACHRARVPEPGFGMVLTIEYTHEGHQPDPSKKPPKEYRANLEIISDADNDPRFLGQGGRSIRSARGVAADQGAR